MATDYLGLTQITETQLSKYLSANQQVGQIDSAIAGGATVLISTTTPVVIASSVSTRAVRFVLTDDTTPPAAAFTVQFPATRRGFVNVGNATAQDATLEISGQASPPVLPAGESRIYMVTDTQVLEVGSGSGGGGGGSGDAITWHGARRHFSTYSPAGTGAYEVVSLDAAVVDTDSLADASNGFTIPAGVDKVRLRATVVQASGTTPSNKWAIFKNGVSLPASSGGFVGKVDTSGSAIAGECFESGTISVAEGDTLQLVIDVDNITPAWDGWFEIEVVEGTALGTYTFLTTTQLQPFYEATLSSAVAVDTYTAFSVPAGVDDIELAFVVPATTNGVQLALRVNGETSEYAYRRFYSYSTSTEDSDFATSQGRILVQRNFADTATIQQLVTVRISQPQANGPVYFEGRVNAPGGTFSLFSGNWLNTGGADLSEISFAAATGSDPLPANTYVRAYDPMAVGQITSTTTQGAALVETSGGSASTSAFAMKGNILFATGAWKINAGTAMLNPAAAGEQYRFRIYNMSAGAITSELAESDLYTSVGSDSVKPIFAFTTPPTLVAGNEYAFVVVRVDGTGTSVCHVNYESVVELEWAGFTFDTAVEHNEVNPVDTTSLTTTTGSFMAGVFVVIAELDSAFTDLSDTPNAYTGHASKRLVVKADETGIEFEEIPASGGGSTPFEMVVAVSDETTDLVGGITKVTFRMPVAVTLTGVRASLTTASTSGPVTVDINDNGTTILSTKLTIDQDEKTSTTAATAAVISDSALGDDAEITVDIDGAGTGAKGLKIALIGTRT